MYIWITWTISNITCFTGYSSPSRFTCKACSILSVTCVVITVGGTRQVTVTSIYSRFTLQTCSILYVTCAIFAGDGARNVTRDAINTGSLTSYIQLKWHYYIYILQNLNLLFSHSSFLFVGWSIYHNIIHMKYNLLIFHQLVLLKLYIPYSRFIFEILETRPKSIK